MATELMAWAALLGGLIVMILSLGAHDRRWKLRLRTAAALAGVWSGALLVAHLLPRGDLTAVGHLGAANNVSALVPILLGTGFMLAVVAAFVIEFRWDPAREFVTGIHSPMGRLWMRLTRALTDAPMLDSMLMEAVSAFRRATGARVGHVYRITSPGAAPEHIGSAADGDGRLAGVRAAEAVLDTPAETAALCARQEDRPVVRIDHLRGRLLGIPIGVNGTTHAVMVLEDPQIDCHRIDVSAYLHGMGTLVGRCLHDWTLAVRGATYGTLCENLSHLLGVLLEEDQLERGLPPVADALSDVIPLDYVSIAWQTGTSRHEDRASMAIGNGRIVENRRRWPIAETTSRARKLRRPLITPDLLMAVPEETDKAESWESRLGMRSRMVSPIQHAGVVIGTLTVAHELPARYGEEEARLIGIVCDVLALWLGGLALRQSHDRWEAAEALTDRLRSDPWRWTDLPTVLQEVQAQLDVSGMRLYRLIPETGELLEAASTGRVAVGTPPRKLSLSDLPWHRFALDRSQSLRVDQDDPEMMMDRGEAAKALIPEFRTANIVPVTTGGSVLGFLDVMEARDPDRKSLQPSDHFLVRTVADHAARLWSATIPRHGQGENDNGAGQLTAKLRELHRHIVNPITSIIGSVELIRHKQPGLSGDTIKYLNTIERSAMRIQESTAGFYDGITPGRSGDVQKATVAESSGSYAPGAGRRGTFTRPASMMVAESHDPERDSGDGDRSRQMAIGIQG